MSKVILQEDKTVAYASEAFTEAEQCYVQAEKEMLAVVCRAERLHQYVHGKEVEVQTNHKSLKAIMKKRLSSAPARIQKLLIRFQKFHLKIHYKPGK